MLFNDSYIGERYRISRITDKETNILFEIYWSVIDQADKDRKIGYFKTLTDAGKYCNYLNKYRP